VNTNGEIMAIMMRQYTDGERLPHAMHGVVTGKDVRIGGSEGRLKATGQGVVYCIEEWARSRDFQVRGARVLLQGFGNVGSATAEILTGMGAKIVAVNDANGTIHNDAGIDIPALLHHVYQNPDNLKKTVLGFPGATPISKSDFWKIDAAIAVPAALGGEVDGDVAEALRVKLVIEAANGPTTAEGDRVLAARKIDVIPDILANAGGVTVSYYEWLQNHRMEHWTEQEVNTRLERAMKSNFAMVQDIARNTPTKGALHDSRAYCIGRPVDMRTAAMILALKRIEAHYLLVGFSQ
jgi:glutamate dehydrogenase (NAD(P)+)